MLPGRDNRALRIQVQGRMRKLTYACSLVLFLLCGPYCKVLFWQDARSWTGGRWVGESVFYEMEQRFQTKAHWFALNQNALTRNYETAVLRHSVAKDKSEATTVTRFKGWALENSLYVLGDRILLIRGTTDALGGAERELVLVSLSGSSGGASAPVVLLKPKLLMLAALPSFDGSQLAVVTTSATMSKPTGEVFVDLFGLRDGAISESHRVTVKWKGAPGMPNVAWASDGSRFYVHRNQDVMEVSAATGAVGASHRFPKCWLQSTSNVSDAGRAFFRDGPEGTIEIRRTEGWIVPSRVPLTGDIKKIGEGCP